MRKASHVCQVLCAALSFLAPVYAGSDETADLRALTGARTRVVWCQAADKYSTDVDALGVRLKLMGLDTDDIQGIREIRPEAGNYHKPLITPKGDRIVFTDYPKHKVMVVNWDGSGLREVAEGLATDVWMDPLKQMEWVYVITGPVNTNEDFAGKPLERFQLDDPKVREMVWDQTAVCPDNFQVSADGRSAAGLFPWPNAGLAQLPNASWKKYATGCWSSMSPDNSDLFWVFDGAHRNVTLYDPVNGGHWRVPINQAPGVGRFEVYHPRWSNHALFLGLTGPYTIGEGGERVAGGGRDVEIHVGRFSPDLRKVEAWCRVTDNKKPDFYPDVWVEGGGGAVKVGSASAAAVEQKPAAKIVLEGKLVAVSRTPTLAEIAPYRSALVVYTYEVAKVSEGECAAPRVLVAHWVIRDGQTLPWSRKVGDVCAMTLERYEDHPELEGQRLVMDSEEFDLPMFYDVGL